MPVRVSIILPSLNVVDYIEETLDSVKAQSLHDIEIICIDAGSTDGTWEIIQKSSCGDSRFKMIRSSIKSYGYQVNMGLELAKGEYVAILETDDYVTSEMYEILYEKASRWNVDYVKCDYCAFYKDKNNNRRLISRVISKDDKYYKKPFCPKDETRVAIDDWYLWNGIYKRRLISDNDISFSETPGAAFQDIGFLHQVLSYAQKAIFINDNMYRYRIDRDEASSKSNKSMYFIRQEYGRLFTENVKEKSDSMLLYKRMAKSFIRACMDSSDEILTSQKGKEICEWFREKLLYAHDNNLVNVNELPFSMREIYKELLESVYIYIDNRTDRANKLEAFLGEDNDIVIFGCGSYGLEAYKVLMGKGCYIRAFMDNNMKLWGAKIGDVEVISPKNTIELPNETRYVIATEKYSGEIEEQLRCMKKDVQTFIYY